MFMSEEQATTRPVDSLPNKGDILEQRSSGVRVRVDHITVTTLSGEAMGVVQGMRGSLDGWEIVEREGKPYVDGNALRMEVENATLRTERDRLRGHVRGLRALLIRIASSSQKVVAFTLHVLEQTKEEGIQDANPTALAELQGEAERMDDIEGRLETVEGMLNV